MVESLQEERQCRLEDERLRMVDQLEDSERICE